MAKRRSIMQNNAGEYNIVLNGKLVDNSITVSHKKYGSKWSSSDNRSLTFESDAIHFYGSCYNRNSGMVFLPLIVNEKYTKLIIDASISYNNGPGGGIFVGTNWGSESTWIDDNNMNLIPDGRKYSWVTDGTTHFEFNISGIKNLCVFIGMTTIDNPDRGTHVYLKNLYLI